jgi:hypothetical protein
MKYKFSKETKDPNYRCGAPFHGDRILIDIISSRLEESKFFIETGTAYGDTLKFVVDNFSNLTPISCEPDDTRFNVVNSFIVERCDIVKITSPEIFTFISNKYPDCFNQKTLFWLDAHGEYNGKVFWPLREEIEFIKKNFKDYYILIDDFKNPYNTNFNYDLVGGIECSIDYIDDLIKDDHVYFPNYDEITSDAWHSLIGWVIITRENINNDKLIQHR